MKVFCRDGKKISVITELVTLKYGRFRDKEKKRVVKCLCRPRKCKTAHFSSWKGPQLHAVQKWHVHVQRVQRYCFSLLICKFVTFLFPSSSRLLKLSIAILIYVGWIGRISPFVKYRLIPDGWMGGKSTFEDINILLGSLNKHNVDGSEKVIWKCNFAFLQSYFNYSKSLCLKNLF